MKCCKCGFVVNQPDQQDMPSTGLTIFVPEEESPDEDNFGVLLGIWDQRKKERVFLCGACLVDSLTEKAAGHV